MKFMTGVFVINKQKKNNKILDIPPKMKNFRFLILLSLKKLKMIRINKIIKMYDVGVCIDKKAKTHK